MFSIQEENIQEKSHHILYKTDSYMKKEPVKYFPPIFSPISPLLIDKKNDIYFVSKNGEIFLLHPKDRNLFFLTNTNTLLLLLEKAGFFIFPQKMGTFFVQIQKQKESFGNRK